ncbi:MAG: hypothetical protein FJ167_04195 [Gammaproteobacteria bacterium]|nr:hypothetical protein [Gammaproteobacteria bacterium]
MTGYVDEPMRSSGDPWKQDRLYRKVVDGLRTQYESQGNLAVQTVILLTSVEELMGKTNVLLAELNATMSELLVAVRGTKDGEAEPDEPRGQGDDAASES